MTHAATPSLFQYAARATGPVTSQQAAHAANATDRPHGLCAVALAFVAAQGASGATLDQWLAHAGLDTSHSGRFTSLAQAGLIVDTGTRRATRRGRMARVFVARGGRQ